MSEHTKGPWRKCGFNVSVSPKCYYLLKNTDKIAASELSANARLIAASPELLEACVRAHDALLSLHVCNQDNSFANEIRTLLKAAIAKATD